MKKFIGYFVVLSLILFFINSLMSVKYKYQGKKILRIVVKGTFHTDKDDVLDMLSFSKNDLFDAGKLSESIKNIYKMGSYEDVKFDVTKKKNGVVITINVKEREIIDEIRFVGNDEVSTGDLEEKIKDIIAGGEVVDESKLQDAVSVILSKYEEENLFDAEVRVRKEINKEDKKVIIIFNIKEGDEIKVKSIKITGTKVYSEKKLVGLMDTHIDDWLHSGTFNRDEYDKDKDKIIKFYNKNGYIDANIVSEKLQYRIEGDKRDKEKVVYITLKIKEGVKYNFNGYKIKGYNLFTEDEIRKELTLEKGKVFNKEKFIKDMQSIQAMYGARGYIFARVNPIKHIDKTKKTIAYDIDIYEGEIAHIESIIVKGNTKTKDYVITRELLVKEGEIFNARKIQRSQEKIYNLGFFKNVKLDVRPGSAEGLMALIIEVEEQMTGMITLGMVYGTIDGLGGYEEVSENNLLGRGIRINERIEYQANKQEYRAGITYPWIFGSPMNFSFSIFFRNKKNLYTPDLYSTDNFKYNKQEFGINTGLTRRLSDTMSISGSYGISLYQYYSTNSGTPADITIRDKVGKGNFMKSYVVFKFNYDNRDNIFNPTKGLHFSQSWQITGGILGGTDQYMKFISDFSKYFNILWKFVFVTHFNYGLITPGFGEKDMLINADDRFYFGGVETIRGYDYSWRWWEAGGLSRLYGNFELRFPIAEQLLWMVFYVDSGNMWNSSYAVNLDYTKYYYSTGFGFRIQIPMLPIRLYFSKKFYNINDSWYLENKGIGDWVFNFSVGGLF